MPQAQPSTEAAIAWLQRQGYIPRGNNLALVPFDNANATSNVTGSVSQSPPVGTDSNVASSVDGPKNDGTDPIPNKDGTFTDPRTGDKVSAEDALSIWPWLAGAAVAGGGAYAITRALANNKAAQVVPDVAARGDVVPVGRRVVDGGELVPQPRDPLAPLSETQAAIAERKALPAPSKKTPSTQKVTTEQSRISLPDTRSDITPEELARAKEITKQLIANRMKGNAQVAKQGNLKRKYNLPTGTTDEESLLNTVVRLMRMVK